MGSTTVAVALTVTLCARMFMAEPKSAITAIDISSSLKVFFFLGWVKHHLSKE
jgi:hypothetical protein